MTFKKIASSFIWCIMAGIYTMLGPVRTVAQTRAFGFENGITNGWVPADSTGSVSVNTNPAFTRTGSYSLKLSNTDTSASHQWYATTYPFDSSFSNLKIFVIYWAKADAAASADGSFKYSTTLPATTFNSVNAFGSVPLTTTGWKRVTNSVSSASVRYYFPAPRKTTVGAANLYIDDGILYTVYSSAGNVGPDTLKPNAPAAVTGAASGNIVSLHWTSNLDNIGGTGVDSTIILRNANTSAAAPVLNDQAKYSVAGGAGGTNTAGNGWQVVSTGVGATDSTYQDATSATGNYIYAVVLRDVAYNYSAAAMSSSITAGVAAPVIFVNQAGFNGTFGTVSIGSVSAQQQYNVSAYNLSGSLTVTAPAGFQVSATSGSGFSATATIIPVNGTIAPTPVYVRFTPLTPAGATGTQNVSNTSAGATTVNVPVSGNAADAAPTTAGTLTFGTVTASTVVVNLPTIGNGSNRLIAINQGSAITYVPVNGAPVAGVNANYTQATDQGGGDKVVYDGQGSGTNVVTVTGLAPHTLYSFGVFEYNKGTGTTSQAYLQVSPVTALIKTDSLNAGVNNVAQANEITIYPNPAHGTIYIKSAAKVNLSLCDVEGRIISTLGNTTSAILRNLASGLYILTITNDKGELLKKEKVVVE